MRPSIWNSRRLCALIVASSGILWSQSNPVGNITGTVKGPDGKLIAGARVQAVTTRGAQEQKTNAQGEFSFRQLLPGRVQIKVSAPGTSGFDSTLVVVANQTNRMDVKLGALGVVVEVTDQAGMEAIDTTIARTGLVMTMDRIEELPIYYMGTNRLDATTFRAPGSVMDTIHGTDSQHNAYVVDGVSASDANYGGKAVSLNNDFIDQVQILTSGISAKYGRFTGGVLNVTTKSGTNTWSGTSRFEITNDKWNSMYRMPEVAYFYSNLYHFPITWPPVQDKHSITQSYTLLGPIIKDRLFFALAYQTNSPETRMVSQTTNSIGPKVPYTVVRDAYLLDAKVDWQINGAQRLTAELNEANSRDENGISSGNSATVAALSGLTKSRKGYWSLGYVAQLSPSLALDVKYNDAFSSSGGPGTGPTGGKNVVTWKELESSDVLDNGYGSDDKAESHTRTGAANLVWVVEANGTHNVEGGFQFYHYNRTGAASPTPSNYSIEFRGYADGATTYDLANRILTPLSAQDTVLQHYFPTHGEADSKVNSLYINDAWALNAHWSFNLGFRFDQYKASTSPEGISYDFKAVTPRLSASYDVTGDKKHVVSVGFAEYSGMINQGNLASATVTSSPITRQYVYVGTGGARQGTGADALLADGSINWNAWGNRQGQTGIDHPNYVSDPLTDRNIFVDPDIKAPRTREVTLGYTWTGTTRSFSATLIRRWNDQFLDDFWIGNGMAPGKARIVIKNDPNARQDYYGLEMTYRQRIGDAFTVGGNATWSRTFENAGVNLGGAASQANDFGAGNIPSGQLNPMGPAPGLDVPLMVNADASYRHTFGSGTLNVGLVGTYKSGAAVAFRSAMANVPASLMDQGYASAYTRYFPELGVVRQPEVWTMDLQTGYDQALAGKVRFYVRVNIINVFNRVRPMTRDTSGTVVYQGQVGQLYPPPPVDGTTPSNQFNPSRTYGLGQGNMFPRMVQLITGLKF
ncbi:TonB-dependent receptor [Mesoterricola sediminis]|uniref:TonB-dependent receptor n=1 Tax=Mesoterricola sediminis TaxID=2927980 RepID=UPI001FB00422|nr:TonB-dependent receptor [Mesoterricola sediminis]